MAKRILILKGSPRTRGNSSVLADQVEAGAKASGADVESIYLHALDIRSCDACDACAENGGNCIIDDDMQSIYPKLFSADALVMASPIYWFTISAQLKLCIDRWYALQPAGWKKLAGKKIGIVLTYGDSDLQTSGGINAVHTFESMFRYLDMEIAGMVHGTAGDIGDIEKHPDLMMKAFQLGQDLAGAAENS